MLPTKLQAGTTRRWRQPGPPSATDRPRSAAGGSLCAWQAASAGSPKHTPDEKGARARKTWAGAQEIDEDKEPDRNSCFGHHFSTEELLILDH
eukprot:scaffold219688_cov15-Tisochrysis_lutea.AAC.1